MRRVKRKNMRREIFKHLKILFAGLLGTLGLLSILSFSPHSLAMICFLLVSYIIGLWLLDI